MAEQVSHLIRQGKRKAVRGDFEAAICDYSAALQLAPCNLKALSARGRARERVDDFDGAIEDFTKMIELRPQDFEALYRRGVAKFIKGDFKSSIADFTDVLQLASDKAYVWFARGDAWQELSEWQKSAHDYSEGLQIDPKNVLALLGRAGARLEIAELEGAATDCKLALRLKPNNIEAQKLMQRVKQMQSSKANWRMESLPQMTVVPYLESYGFDVIDASVWRSSPSASGLMVRFEVNGHISEIGHTWYVLDCHLIDAKLAGDRLCWSTRRRLLHLREGLHDPFKDDVGDEAYTRYFEQAPFALKGGLPGTTARLTAWFHALALCIHDAVPTPSMVAHVLQFLEISDPMTRPTDECDIDLDIPLCPE